MLEKEMIVRLSVKIKKEPIIQGIYFLLYNDEIVYIGQAIDILARIKMHRSNPRLKFLKYFYIEYNSKEERTRLEKKYIENFCPKYNIEYNPKARQDMLMAIELMTDEDRKYYNKSINNFIGWWMVEIILNRHGIKSKYKTVNSMVSDNQELYLEMKNKNS